MRHEQVVLVCNPDGRRVIGGLITASAAAPINLNMPTAKFVTYCEANDADCALFLDSVLAQFLWDVPEGGQVCKGPPANFQTEDARKLLLPWIRANGFTSDTLAVSVARATIALTSSLCTSN